MAIPGNTWQHLPPKNYTIPIQLLDVERGDAFILYKFTLLEGTPTSLLCTLCILSCIVSKSKVLKKVVLGHSLPFFAIWAI